MAITIKMPALSPTMEEGTLARWLVKAGDKVEPGDVIAEIETDKATMEFESIDEGTIAAINVEEGSSGVKVGTVIAVLAEEGEDVATAASPSETTSTGEPQPVSEKPDQTAEPAEKTPEKSLEAKTATPATPATDRAIASPLARRLAAANDVDLSQIGGSGPRGRVIKADVEAALAGGTAPKAPPKAAAVANAPAQTEKVASVDMAPETRALLDDRIPHSVEKLSGMRKTIARRLTASMHEAPHIYLTVDVRLDRLMAMRAEMNEALVKQGVKLSVNDMLIKALGKALIDVPECNVTFAGSELVRYQRSDISVAVSIPGGLITPIVQDANGRSLSSIATAMKDLGERAKTGKLQASEYQGGTASISNMGMMGIKQFTAVINPPQATILAIGAGEKRPTVIDGKLDIATMMTATGSFDHRAVDGADGARLMAAFREYVESPLGMVA